MKKVLFGLKKYHLSTNYNKPSYKDKDCCNYTDSLYENLKNNRLDILLDDRDESAGKKFADADLSGIPLKLIIGKNFLNKNLIGVSLEIQIKRN